MLSIFPPISRLFPTYFPLSHNNFMTFYAYMILLIMLFVDLFARAHVALPSRFVRVFRGAFGCGKTLVKEPGALLVGRGQVQSAVCQFSLLIGAAKPFRIKSLLHL